MTENTESRRQEKVQALPDAEIVELTGSGSTTYLVLRVNIEGRDHELRLSLSALRGYGVTDQEAANELRKIWKKLDSIEGLVPVSREIANDLFHLMDLRYRLPERETE